MLPAHLAQLQRIKNLNVGMQWAARCPDESGRIAMADLLTEEILASIDGLMFRVGGGKPEGEVAASSE